jgi:hypothetical protein
VNTLLINSKFKGSLFGSGRFYISMIIIIAAVTGTILYGDFNNWQSLLFVALIGGLCIWLLLTSVYFFELDGNILVVRNHLLFWIRIEYEISNIAELSIEKNAKSAIGLRIRTRSGLNKRYEAATIYYSSWRKLKTELENRGLVVRNLAV